MSKKIQTVNNGRLNVRTRYTEYGLFWKNCVALLKHGYNVFFLLDVTNVRMKNH
jgi:hypothetical protein